MQLLVDTHSVLWYAFGSSKLSAKAKILIDDPQNDCFLSIASPWEVGIKVSTGKLTLTKPVEAFFADQVRLLSLQMLPITLAHIARVAILPFHHRDPFDRMLAAQSLTDSLPLVSADAAFDAYGIQRLW